LNLGLAYAEADADGLATVVIGRALDDAVDSHGYEHRHTIAIRAGLASCHAATGEQTAAAAELDRAIADCTTLLGADRPDTAELQSERAALGDPVSLPQPAQPVD
jgi:hypothetical protein